VSVHTLCFLNENIEVRNADGILSVLRNKIKIIEDTMSRKKVYLFLTVQNVKYLMANATLFIY
jgi:hypothetical protein